MSARAKWHLPAAFTDTGPARDTERAGEVAAIITQEIYVGGAGRLGAGEREQGLEGQYWGRREKNNSTETLCSGRKSNKGVYRPRTARRDSLQIVSGIFH